jgi:16S rRNA C1402 N4-methylase RsmH
LAYRKQNRIDTTFKLREIIRSSSYDPKSVVRIFQAIRIALNEEFDNIRQVIQAAVPLLVS